MYLRPIVALISFWLLAHPAHEIFTTPGCSRAAAHNDTRGQTISGWVRLVSATRVPAFASTVRAALDNFRDEVGHHKLNIELDHVCERGELDVSIHMLTHL